MIDNQSSPQEQQQNDNNLPTTVKVAKRAFGFIGCGMLELILAAVGTPIGFLILFAILFQPKIEIVSLKNHETQKNVSCSEGYVKKWGKLALSGEISAFSFELKDGANEDAGIFPYEGDLHVRINGKERCLVKQGVLDESVEMIEPDMDINKGDSLNEIGYKLGLSLARVILVLLNKEIKGIEGVPQAIVFVPIIKMPGKKLAAHTLYLEVESKPKGKFEFSTDGQNWYPLPFSRNQMEKIFGSMLDDEELKRREELRQQRANELSAEWEKWLEAAKKGKEKIEDIKERIDQGKEKIEQGRALLERGRNLINKKEDDEPVPDP